MATILFAWELGGGLGHVSRLARVAGELATLGHAPVFALRNLVESRRVLAGAGFPMLQAPYWHPRPWSKAQPFIARSYADVLARHGYTDEADLLPMVGAWQCLFDLVKPGLIVADHSPTVCLAARGSIPVVLLGEGYTMPPAEGDVYPDLVPSVEAVVPQQRVAEVIHAVQARRGRPVPETLPALLATAARYTTIVAPLDPYRQVRVEPLFGPLDDWPEPVPPPEPRAFLYLSGEYPEITRIVGAFAQAGVACSAYFRSASVGFMDRLRAAGVEVFNEPQPLVQTLAGCGALVHHGGATTATAGLVAGRPQLLLPTHLEQELNARALIDLGVGAILSGPLTLQAIGETLRSLMNDPVRTERAMAVAAALRTNGGRGCLREIVERCHTLAS